MRSEATRALVAPGQRQGTEALSKPSFFLSPWVQPGQRKSAKRRVTRPSFSRPFPLPFQSGPPRRRPSLLQDLPQQSLRVCLARRKRDAHNRNRPACSSRALARSRSSKSRNAMRPKVTRSAAARAPLRQHRDRTSASPPLSATSRPSLSPTPPFSLRANLPSFPPQAPTHQDKSLLPSDSPNGVSLSLNFSVTPSSSIKTKKSSEGRKINMRQGRNAPSASPV